ncbi:phosphosulfolactate synthase [Tsukamurella soli]|uniref:Phosphosulfolactate synthase n=1 Tax=Tsukamurella soli TaxID=644556 RepID=A0ABP8J309_9ACTN
MITGTPSGADTAPVDWAASAESARVALGLPERDAKPRQRGLTMAIDHGLPTAQFADLVRSIGDYVDLLKFGWGTCLATPQLCDKITAARDAGVEFYFGGTLFERFYLSGCVDRWADLCRAAGARVVEISNGTVPMRNEEKAEYIARFAGEFTVLSEVGYKDPDRSETLSPVRWIEYIRQDLAAGAALVITEAREHGSSGICRPNGELRYGLIEEIVESGIDLNTLLFEAPNQQLQAHLLRRLGPHANLGNIAPDEVVGLETLRLGLRSDTLTDFLPTESAGDAGRPGQGRTVIARGGHHRA